MSNSYTHELNTGDVISDSLLKAPFSAENMARLRSLALQPDELAARPLPYERLDQLVFDLLLGVG